MSLFATAQPAAAPEMGISPPSEHYRVSYLQYMYCALLYSGSAQRQASRQTAVMWPSALSIMLIRRSIRSPYAAEGSGSPFGLPGFPALGDGRWGMTGLEGRPKTARSLKPALGTHTYM